MVCSFGLCFLYVLSGWEGSIVDMAMYQDTCAVDLPIPEGKTYLADVSQLAMGCVTCHTCHGCMMDFRPILGNPVEVTHVTSPGHVYIFPH